MSSLHPAASEPAMGKKGRFEHAFAIIRLDEFALPESSLEDCVTVTAIVPDVDSAEREVERLNKQAREGVRYVWQTTRLKQAPIEIHKWSPENRISDPSIATSAKQPSAKHIESSRGFLESLSVPLYISTKRSKGGFGFPEIRVYEACQEASSVHYVRWHDMLARVLVCHDERFSEVVGTSTHEGREIAMFAFRVFPDLCSTPLSDLSPLDIVTAFAERFGLEMYVGANRGKFFLQEEFEMPRILIPNNQEGQIISIVNPDNKPCVTGFVFKAQPPNVSIALAFCIDTNEYDKWLSSHNAAT